LGIKINDQTLVKPIGATARLSAKLLYPLTKRLELGLKIFNARWEAPEPSPSCLSSPLTLTDIRRLTLDYVQKMRLTPGGEFLGYRHSASTTRPVLYATLAALLLKHLYGVADDQTQEELAYVSGFQRDDGLFYDPVIDCPEAEIEDWWGWRHLTLHALMTLAIYQVPARQKIHYWRRFTDNKTFRQYLTSRDWGARAAWTSNELQNLGVMLQYARDYQNSLAAQDLLETLYEVMEANQDPRTGLYGHRFASPGELSLGVQAGYHFWLLYFYDQRPLPFLENIIDQLLQSQNLWGGYGVERHSSACEDIDSIDPLMRLSRLTDYRREEVQGSLERALPAVLHNLNEDGGFVFRRHSPLTFGHPQMFSAADESNLFFTWFRTLGLAYCFKGLEKTPPQAGYDWNFTRAPGHQFL